jgi:hypothetical protein
LCFGGKNRQKRRLGFWDLRFSGKKQKVIEKLIGIESANFELFLLQNLLKMTFPTINSCLKAVDKRNSMLSSFPRICLVFCRQKQFLKNQIGFRPLRPPLL